MTRLRNSLLSDNAQKKHPVSKYDEMDKEKIKLKENHRRSLSSALAMTEKMLTEIEDSLKNIKDTCCYKVENDVDPEKIQHNLLIIQEAREQICKLAAKYSTDRQNQNLSRLINAKKTKIWEILCDTKSRKQKGFGEFPKELVKEFDEDIDRLMEITNKITF